MSFELFSRLFGSCGGMYLSVYRTLEDHRAKEPTMVWYNIEGLKLNQQVTQLLAE